MPQVENTKPPSFPAPDVKARQRQTPNPGASGGGGGGTSSARPTDLRSFANGSASLNQALDGKPGILSGSSPTSTRRAPGRTSTPARWSRRSNSGSTRTPRTSRGRTRSRTPSPQPWRRERLHRGGLGARRGAAGLRVSRRPGPRSSSTRRPRTVRSRPRASRWTRSTRRRATSSSQNSTSASQVRQRHCRSPGCTTPSTSASAVRPGLGVGVRDPARTRRRGRLVRRRRRPADPVPARRRGMGARGRREPVARGRGRRTGRQRQRWRSHHLHPCRAAGPGRRADRVRRSVSGGTTTIGSRDWCTSTVVRSTWSTWASASRSSGFRRPPGRVRLRRPRSSGHRHRRRWTRRYGWNDDDLVVTVTSAAGVVEVDNTYDDVRRVTEQVSPHGRTVRFA